MLKPIHKALVYLVIGDAFISTVIILPILFFILKNNRFPVIFGVIEAMKGPFEKLGTPAFFVSGLIFVAISALKYFSAYWLWNMKFEGVALQLVLLGISAIFWYGYMIPYGPLLGVIQIILIVIAWNDFV